MKLITILLLFFISSVSFLFSKKSNETLSSHEIINPFGKTLETRFGVPAEYKRVEAKPHSFSSYLRKLPLKKDGTEVTYFNGETKKNIGIYDAVVDLPIGDKNLHQCADAIMRLRAEYLWSQKQYEKIHFNFTNGFRVDYSEWMKGKRIIVEGNKTKWSSEGQFSNSYSDFWQYLETIFMYAGTLSLSKELQTVAISDIQIGDVFIYGGSPGHAVIVVDLAFHSETGKQMMMLAQSYMPAQEIQILKNQTNKELSPWYPTTFKGDLETPEWIFSQDQLKRFVEE